MDSLAKKYIELQVEQLHRRIWKQRDRFSPDGNWSLTELFDPQSACEVLGVQYERVSFIDARFARAEEGNTIAGLIDRQSNRVVVCDTQSPQVMRFTGGHEIGHWCLHPDQVLHRDMPLSGSDVPIQRRSAFEQEADYFSACFLMPAKAVRMAFQKQFNVRVPLQFDDRLAYWLSPEDPESLLYVEQKSLAREKALSRCTALAGRTFPSLADQFKVSVGAMALRIRELKLVSWP